MSLRSGHEVTTSSGLCISRCWGQSRNWVSRLSLFRRGDGQSEAEDLFARKASVPQEEQALPACVAVLLSSGLLLVFSVVPLDTVHPVRTVKGDCQWD